MCFDFSLSNFNLEGHRLNSTENALRVYYLYSSSFSVKLDKILNADGQGKALLSRRQKATPIV